MVFKSRQQLVTATSCARKQQLRTVTVSWSSWVWSSKHPQLGHSSRVTAGEQLRAVHTSDSFSASKGQQLTPEELKARQDALMRHSLPKRRRLPGVKNIVLVSSGKGAGNFKDFYLERHFKFLMQSMLLNLLLIIIN